ncbi:hypothetical protein ABBQ38_000159 [Trebouxia sp. C0009 RCD-2024]
MKACQTSQHAVLQDAPQLGQPDICWPAGRITVGEGDKQDWAVRFARSDYNCIPSASGVYSRCDIRSCVLLTYAMPCGLLDRHRGWHARRQVTPN